MYHDVFLCLPIMEQFFSLHFRDMPEWVLFSMLSKNVANNNLNNIEVVNSLEYYR